MYKIEALSLVLDLAYDNALKIYEENSVLTKEIKRQAKALIIIQRIHDDWRKIEGK